MVIDPFQSSHFDIMVLFHVGCQGQDPSIVRAARTGIAVKHLNESLVRFMFNVTYPRYSLI